MPAKTFQVMTVTLGPVLACADGAAAINEAISTENRTQRNPSFFTTSTSRCYRATPLTGETTPGCVGFLRIAREGLRILFEGGRFATRDSRPDFCDRIATRIAELRPIRPKRKEPESASSADSGSVAPFGVVLRRQKSQVRILPGAPLTRRRGGASEPARKTVQLARSPRLRAA